MNIGEIAHIKMRLLFDLKTKLNNILKPVFHGVNFCDWNRYENWQRLLDADDYRNGNRRSMFHDDDFADFKCRFHDWNSQSMFHAVDYRDWNRQAH